MNTNKDLINELIRGDYLNTLRIIHAFEKVKRADFVLPEAISEAYENFPLPIGHGQTISQPATVALMLEKLQPEAGNKILDIGSGSGWQTALLAEIAGEEGKVFGLEIKDDLIDFSKKNLAKYDFNNIEILKGDGWEGLPKEAPFDRIIVAAAAETIPKALKQQLKIGGRLVIPVGRGLQDVIVADKISEDNFEETYYPGFIFVPLINGTDEHGCFAE